MKLLTIKNLLSANVLTGEKEQALSEIDIKSACGCDLMSDVLAFVKDQGLLLTGLVNNQVIRTAEMMDIKAICFVRGKTPDKGIIELAARHNMPVLQTGYPLFIACGKLYDSGLMHEED